LFLSHRLTPLSSLPFHHSFFFSPFLNILSQRCYHGHWLAWLLPTAGLSQSRLALALSDMGEASHRSHPYRPHATKTLPSKLIAHIYQISNTSPNLIPTPHPHPPFSNFLYVLDKTIQTRIQLIKFFLWQVLLLSLTHSALASSRSDLEPDGIGSIKHGGGFCCLLTEATPEVPLPWKRCHVSPIQSDPKSQVYYIVFFPSET